MAETDASWSGTRRERGSRKARAALKSLGEPCGDEGAGSTMASGNNRPLATAQALILFSRDYASRNVTDASGGSYEPAVISLKCFASLNVTKIAGTWR